MNPRSSRRFPLLIQSVLVHSLNAVHEPKGAWPLRYAGTNLTLNENVWVAEFATQCPAVSTSQCPTLVTTVPEHTKFPSPVGVCCEKNNFPCVRFGYTVYWLFGNSAYRVNGAW